MSTTVVNIKAREPFDVYIGRRSLRAKDPRCRVASPWANRPLEKGQTREQSISDFERRLRWNLEQMPSLREQLLALRGKRLGCWCKPEACHGDVLVRVIEEIAGGVR